MHSNAKNVIFKKACQATTVTYSVMWISPRYFVHIGSIGNPLIPDAEKQALQPFYQFVVNQNYSEYIIEIDL